MGSYASGYRPYSYNQGSRQAGYGAYGSYNNKKRVGSYGNPYQVYHGPGLAHLAYQPKDGYGSARYHEVLGKGVVIGKYSFTDGKTYEMKDYDEKVIAGPNDLAYKEALEIAKKNGYGTSELKWDDDKSYIGIEHVKNKEAITDTYALKHQIDIVNAKKKKSAKG